MGGYATIKSRGGGTEFLYICYHQKAESDAHGESTPFSRINVEPDGDLLCIRRDPAAASRPWFGYSPSGRGGRCACSSVVLVTTASGSPFPGTSPDDEKDEEQPLFFLSVPRIQVA